MRIVVDRPVIALLALLGGGVSVAVADPPATHDAASPATAPAAPATSTAAVTPPAAATAADAKAASAADAEAALEKRLTNSGYKPRMRNGTKVWCKKQEELGSRLGVQESCGTPDELRQIVRENQQVVEQIQKVSSNPTGK